MTDRPSPDAISDRILQLCRRRGPEKSICPSEVARSLISDESAWRALMGEIRDVARQLAEEGLIDIRQGGKLVSLDEISGPIRLNIRHDG